MPSPRKPGNGAKPPGLRAACLLAWMFAFATGAQAGNPSDDFFEQKIRPLLTEQCLKCHGEKKQQGGLRLDSREALLKGGIRAPRWFPASRMPA